MRDLAKRVQQDKNVTAATESHVPFNTDDDVAFIKLVYQNSTVEEVKVVNEMDMEIICVLNSGEDSIRNDVGSDGDIVAGIKGGETNNSIASHTVIPPAFTG